MCKAVLIAGRPMTTIPLQKLVKTCTPTNCVTTTMVLPVERTNLGLSASEEWSASAAFSDEAVKDAVVGFPSDAARTCSWTTDVLPVIL